MWRWYINRHARKLFEGVTLEENSKPWQEPTIPLHSASDLQKSLSKISRARKPLSLIGSGAMMNAEKANMLANAVSRLGVPVFLSGMARGLLGAYHPLQMRHHRKQAIRDSDLIILAGVPNDFRLDYGNHIGRKAFISINRSRIDLYQNKRPALPVQADPQEFLIAFADRYKGQHTEWIQHLRMRDEQREENIATMSEEVQSGINPLKLFRELNPMLNKNAILVADGGDFVATAAYTLRPAAPLSWLIRVYLVRWVLGQGLPWAQNLFIPKRMFG